MQLTPATNMEIALKANARAVRISSETTAQMIDVHMRADPYSPYGMHKASFEAGAMRATNPNAKRALWLAAARHWREVMRSRLAMRNDQERSQALRAYKFARIAVSAAHHVGS